MVEMIFDFIFDLFLIFLVLNNDSTNPIEQTIQSLKKHLEMELKVFFFYLHFSKIKKPIGKSRCRKSVNNISWSKKRFISKDV
jgi:hypothetical protein